MPRRAKGELPIPPAAIKDAKAEEMIRAWVAAEGLHCSLNIGMWQGVHTIDEPSAWGIMLADVVRHVANGLEEPFGIDHREGCNRIREAFQIELDHPTSNVRGSFGKGTKR